MDIEYKALQQKWTKRWHETKVFEANADKKRPKFFVHFTYPYVNAYPHLGHFYTLMRSEALARFKRMQGYNVLMPQGWHATGSPIVSAARRVKEREPKQLKILKDMGIPDSVLQKFEEPAYWIEFFKPEFKKDWDAIGISVDWRREYFTTELNPHYDKFIRWQFLKLFEKGYVIKESFPVVWDPIENCPVGDHDRSEGEGERPKDFIWVKFKVKGSDLILMAGTTRPDALLGQTHIWVDPEATYKIVKVKDEKWVVGEDAIKKIEYQYSTCEVIGNIHAKELMGKWVKGPLVKYDIYIVPGWFIDAKVGSGIVYSALEDPVDLIEIQDIQKDLGRIKKYNLDVEVIKKLKPISIIKVPELSDNLGQEMIDKYKIQSAKEKNKIKDAKDELNKTVFRKGVMKNNCGKYAGMTVPDAQESIKKDIIKTNDAAMFYELTGKVISRSLHECDVKIVHDQWFIAYGNPQWKKDAHNALKKIKLYPDKVRQQFEYTIDWLHDWACTREEGLGTRLPWDEKWLIESLSDSTIYLAFYPIAHLLQKLDIKYVNDALFDYVMLGKGPKPKVPHIDEMRAEFDYWYPFDFNGSGKDLIQNHLTFALFNHVAIFPKEKWPQGYGVNGWVMVDGKKMSKSLGNFILLRELNEKYGADASRFTILAGGEGLDDPNWETELAKTMVHKLEHLHGFCIEHYGKGTGTHPTLDRWLESKVHEIIKTTTAAMEETNYRTALQSCYYELQKALRWYMRRCNNNTNKELFKNALETQVLLLAPFTPFMTEEIWEKFGKKGGITIAPWPTYNTKKIIPELDLHELFIQNTLEDVHEVMKLIKQEKPTTIKLFIAQSWRYECMSLLKSLTEKTKNPGELLKEVMRKQSLRQYGQEIGKIVPKIMHRLPQHVADEQTEYMVLVDAQHFLSEEFKCPVEIYKASESNDPKAQHAWPGKVAIKIV